MLLLLLVVASVSQVMGYSRRGEVSAESLKTKRRQLVLAVHPDKVCVLGAVGEVDPGLVRQAVLQVATAVFQAATACS